MHPLYRDICWGEPEQAPPYYFAIRNSSMVHVRNQHNQCLHPVRHSEEPPLLQADLDSIFQWSKTSHLTFNESKCIHLHFWNFYSSECGFTINKNLVDHKESTSDLGIIITSNLNWSLHYNHIIAKCYSLLCRTFSTNNADAKKNSTYHL